MRSAILSAVLATALLLPGCSKHDASGGKAAVKQSNDKDLVKAIGGQSHLKTLADALKTTGLAGIFANAGSYTLIAPTDDAFAKLGDKGRALNNAPDRAALANLVRDHLVPGYLTRNDIAKAIQANAGKPVKMATLGSGELSFAKNGDAISVTAKDGASGRLTGEPIAAGPSIALPVDTVLKKL